jgi:exonuclease III
MDGLLHPDSEPVMSSSAITIAILNCKGLNSEEKRKSLMELVKKDTYILLQETHSTTETAEAWNELKRKKWFACHGARNSRGVITLNRTKDPWEEVFQWSGRIISCTFNLFGSKTRLINVYAPNTNGTRVTIAQYEEFLSILDTHLGSSNLPTILAGDLNIIFNKILDAETVSPSSYFPGLVKQWETKMSKYKLKDVWRELHPDEHSYTFTPGGDRGRNIYRRLDYCLMSEELIPLVQYFTTQHTHISDHKILRLQLRSRHFKPPFRVWKHKDNLLQSPEYVTALANCVTEAGEEAQELSSKSSRWEYIKYKLRRKARALEKETIINERKERVDLQTFISDNVRNRLNDREKTEALVRLKQLEAEAMERLRMAAKVEWVENNEQSTNFFFNRIKQNSADSNIIQLAGDGGTTLDNIQINNEIHRFYSDLYKARPTTTLAGSWLDFAKDMDTLTQAQKEALAKPISEKEVEAVLFRSMKSGKAPGNDGLTVALYKALWKHLKGPLLDALVEGIDEGCMCPSQRQAIIRLIRKKDKDPSILKNWRPISLMNVDAKLFSASLANRLKPLIPHIVSEEQLGFVQGRLITDGTKLLRYIFEDASCRNALPLSLRWISRKPLTVSHMNIFPLSFKR